MSSGPPSISAVRYLARRPSETIFLPERRLAKSGGNGKRKSAARLDRDDAGAFHHRLQPAPDGLDLGKLRHDC